MRIDVISALGVLMAPLLFGLIIGSTGPSIDTMKNEVKNFEGQVYKLDQTSRFVVFDENQAAIYSALVTIGAIGGSLASGYIANLVGYKGTILVTIPMYLASSIMLFTMSDVMVLFAARTLLGMAVGINSFVVPNYLADLAPVSLRGRFGTANQLCITVGILAVYLLGMLFKVDEAGKAYRMRPMYNADDQADKVYLATIQETASGVFCNWRALALVNAIPAIILGIAMLLIPESPSWLASNSKLQEALTALARLRGGQETQEEIEALERISNQITAGNDAGGNSMGFWTLLRNGWRQISIAIALQFFQQFSGINAIMFYCTSIMREAKVPRAELVSVTVMLEQVVVTGIAVILMDMAGRKVLLIIGASVMAAACGLFGLFFFLQTLLGVHVMVLMFVALYSYIAAFSIGVGAIPWLILGEIFPVPLRSIGASIATLANWSFAFIVTLGFQSAANVIRVEGVMWAFATCCIGLVIFAATVVPETKGKRIEEIQKYFENKGDKSEEKQVLLNQPADKTVNHSSP